MALLAHQFVGPGQHCEAHVQVGDERVPCNWPRAQHYGETVADTIEAVVRQAAPHLPDGRVTPGGLHLARIRSKCIARYRLKAVPGHPEDLIQIGNEQQGMSSVYGCFSIRVRLHHGREWIAFADFEVGRLDLPRLFNILDPHFGWSPRGFPLIAPTT